MPIPLVDLTRQYRSLKADIDAAIQRVLASGQFILGPEVAALERELAAYCGTTHAVAVASGTDALELALKACGIGPGDEVITSAFSFVATAEAILAVGATPVFVDIDPRSYTLDPGAVESQLRPATKAILPVHLFGHPCAMEELMRLATRHQLMVIEDCAQAIGATYRGTRVGAFGRTGCLSFYPTKNLGAYGDGGMVVTNDAAVAQTVSVLRTHGSRTRYHHERLGTNSRLDELQAAILRVKLRHLDQWNEARRQHARRYTEAFSRAGLSEVVVPQEPSGCVHVYQHYPIRLHDRERALQALTQQGIESQVCYPSTLPAQPALRSVSMRSGPCPTAELVTREILSLPMYPELTPELIETVVQTLAQAGKAPRAQSLKAA